ncbi:MAG: hypothetical protein V1744_06610 [Candidatus Altiarchaeota archaeon]
MPEPDEDSEELDEELEGLKAELEKERAKKKPIAPTTPQAQSKPPEQQPAKNDEKEFNELKAELQRERANQGMKKPEPPQPKAITKPQPEEDEKEFDELKAELEKERVRHAVTVTIPVKPKPEQPPKIDQPTTPVQAKPQPEKETNKTTKPQISWSKSPEPEETQEPVEKPKTKTPRASLEPLEDRRIEFEEPRPKKPGGASPLRYAIPLLLIIIVAALGATVLPSLTKTETKYQCWDGSWAADTSQCPPVTTATTEATTTSTTTSSTQTTETTVVTLPAKCYNNSMCEKEIPYKPFCEGKYVKNPDIRQMCIHPGAPQSYCQYTAIEPRLVKGCEDWEYCWLGECYPEYCRNKIRDYDEGEEKVDCGGQCRPCNNTDALCNTNTDCGKDSCITPYCNVAANPTTNCTRNICTDPGTPPANCTIKKTVEVLEVCGWGRICVEGQDDCMEGREGQGNCHDCIQNQGEARIDCGGPCKPCARIPYQYDTLNLTATEEVDYQSYTLKLERLIREINCSTGANIRVVDQYGKSQSRKVTFYENAEYYDLKFGMLQADTSMTTIWVTKQIPL